MNMLRVCKNILLCKNTHSLMSTLDVRRLISNSIKEEIPTYHNSLRHYFVEWMMVSFFSLALLWYFGIHCCTIFRRWFSIFTTFVISICFCSFEYKYFVIFCRRTRAPAHTHTYSMMIYSACYLIINLYFLCAVCMRERERDSVTCVKFSEYF